jgi:hypothetical protein
VAANTASLRARSPRRVLPLLATCLLASPAAPLLAGAPLADEGQRSAAGPALVQPPELAQPRLLAALRSKIPLEPVALRSDPYVIWHAQEPPPPPVGTVCGVRFEPDRLHYRLATFANSVAARAGGFAVTHFGACGTCSTLQDLAVYIEKPDLTAPVRRCGMRWDASSRLKCLEDLGFSTACAETWLYDVENTRHQCFGVCLWSWIEGEAPTQQGGRLNACLQCDEDRSGPVFKTTAGRTRRNSGIHSSIPRPDDEIAPLVHDYVPDLIPR